MASIFRAPGALSAAACPSVRSRWPRPRSWAFPPRFTRRKPSRSASSARLSGGNAQQGIAARNGFQLAVDQANAAGLPFKIEPVILTMPPTLRPACPQP